MKKTLLPLLLCASALTLAGCNLLSPSSGGSKKKKSSSADESAEVSDSASEAVSSSEDKGSDPTSASSSSSSKKSSSSSEAVVSYTLSSAADAVAALMTTFFSETIPSYHDDGDYCVLNFGDSASWDDIMGYCDYFIPEGFEPDGDWADDTLQSGEDCKYLDAYWNNSICLEYLIYTVSGESNENYNGNYLVVEAMNAQA